MRSDDARNVLRVLTGGFVNVRLTEDNVSTYVDKIAELVPDPAVGLAAAVDWIEQHLQFPSIAEFVDECTKESQRRRRRAQQLAVAQAHKVPGTFACRRCEDRRTIEMLDASGALSVLPCPECDPEESAYWNEGHYEPDHDVLACQHPRCVQRAKTIESKVRNRREGGGDDAQSIGSSGMLAQLERARLALEQGGG